MTAAVREDGTIEAMDDETLCDDPVDAAEIAERLGVQVGSVHAWRKRSRKTDMSFPEERWTFSKVPVWSWKEILVWAGESGRLHDDDLRADYEHETGEEPTPAGSRRRLTTIEREP